MIDFHTHILPEMDDGSRSAEQSVAMLREECAQGMETVVLTPHFYPRNESPARFMKRREEAFLRLKNAMAGEADMPELRLGAEVYFFDGISESDMLADLTVAGTELLLVEMPMSRWNDRMLAELAGISRKAGLTPVIAHVDRYLRLNGRRLPDMLAELPVLVQANAGFFLELHSRRLAMRLLRQGKIHLLGSDCHNMTSRTPNLGVAKEKIIRALGSEGLETVRRVEENYFR